MAVLTSMAMAGVFVLPGEAVAAANTGVSDPQVVAAVKEMFAAMGLRELTARSLKASGQGLQETMRSMIAQSADGKTASEKAEIAAGIEKIVPQFSQAMEHMLADPALLDEVLDASVDIYATTFSLGEIKQITAFYKTPFGKRLLEKTPELEDKSMAQMNAILMPRVSKAMAQMIRSNAQPDK